MAEPVLQYLVRAVVPVKVVAEKHELVTSQTITSGDVTSKWSANGIVCSQDMGDRVASCTPLAKQSRKEIGVLTNA